MDDYISREAGFEILQSRLDSISQMSYLNMDWHELDIMRNAIKDAINDIGEVPAANVQPIRHGRWEYYKNNGIFDTHKCTLCGEKYEMYMDIEPTTIYKYCPNCGARMNSDAE